MKMVDQLSHQIIGGAIEVHRLKGAGLIETIYQRCMERELDLRELRAIRQMEVDIEYKSHEPILKDGITRLVLKVGETRE